MSEAKRKPTHSSSSHPNKKRQHVGIDMSRVPACLVNEGYYLIKSDAKIPEHLLCPVCKELYLEPIILKCGHSLCKGCITPRPSYSACPVCKYLCKSLWENTRLQEIIHLNFSEQYTQRKLEFKEAQELKKKIKNYKRSSRFGELSTHFNRFLWEKRCSRVDEIKDHISQEIGAQITREEYEYFLYKKLSSHEGKTQFADIGQYIILRRPTKNHLDWICSNGSELEIKLSPIVILFDQFSVCHSACHAYDFCKRYADILNVDIGEKLPLEVWKHNPVSWIKDVDTGSVQEILETSSKCWGNYDHSSPSGAPRTPRRDDDSWSLFEPIGIDGEWYPIDISPIDLHVPGFPFSTSRYD